MTHDMNQQWGAAKVFILAVMIIAAFSFMSNESPGTVDAALVEGKSMEDTTEVENVDSTQAESLVVATDGESYGKTFYDLDGWPTRGYLSKGEIYGEHLKGNKRMLHRFLKRKKKVMRDFVDTMGQKALEISLYFSKHKGIDIPPSVILAQAINESRYGMSRLAVVGHNYFGIQYRGKKRGVVGSISAKDEDHTGELKEYGFNHYESPWWALYHHANLIKNMYARRLVKGDIPLRDQYFGALCGCDDIRMLASDSKAERVGKGYYYAAACERLANDGKTSQYVAAMRYTVRIHKLDKLDREWQRMKRK